MVLYLETPADAATLRDLLKMLGMNSARELMRQKEDLYKELNLADSSLSEGALIQAMVDFYLFGHCSSFNANYILV